MDRTEALFVISQLMSTGKVIIFQDAKKKAFLQEAQIMKDFRGQIGFGRQMEVPRSCSEAAFQRVRSLIGISVYHIIFSGSRWK